MIVKPIITRRRSRPCYNNGVVFQVAKDSNKPQIQQAVEALFGVKVKAVNTTITKRQDAKRFACSWLGCRSDVKKAYVTLEAGNTIDVHRP